jgi:hypothetical protein
MKKLIILTFISFSILGLNAQEVTSAAGGTKSTADFEVSWTVGETTIQTFSEGSITLTQGFHQPKLIVTPAKIFAYDISINVYPNPTQEFVTIEMNKLHQNSNYSLYNLAGEKISEGDLRKAETRLSLKNQASGSYLLKLTKDNQPLQTFKIVKN